MFDNIMTIVNAIISIVVCVYFCKDYEMEDCSNLKTTTKIILLAGCALIAGIVSCIIIYDLSLIAETIEKIIR